LWVSLPLVIVWTSQVARITPWPLKQSSLFAEPSRQPSNARGEELLLGGGFYVIRVNQLYEFPWSVRERDGSLYFIDQRPLKALRDMPPISWAGYSIRIYSAQQLRAAYQTLPREIRLSDLDSHTK